jgi:hypothetical protein
LLACCPDLATKPSVCRCHAVELSNPSIGHEWPRRASAASKTSSLKRSRCGAICGPTSPHKAPGASLRAKITSPNMQRFIVGIERLTASSYARNAIRSQSAGSMSAPSLPMHVVWFATLVCRTTLGSSLMHQLGQMGSCVRVHACLRAYTRRRVHVRTLHRRVSRACKYPYAIGQCIGQLRRAYLFNALNS